MKIKINSNFRAYWGEKTPVVGDVFTVESKNEKGYCIKLDESGILYLVYYYEADLVFE